MSNRSLKYHGGTETGRDTEFVSRIWLLLDGLLLEGRALSLARRKTAGLNGGTPLKRAGDSRSEWVMGLWLEGLFVACSLLVRSLLGCGLPAGFR